MFAGKSTELIRRAHRVGRKNKCVIVNSVLDVRTDESVQNHNGVKISALKVRMLHSLRSREEYQNAQVVFIDEAQFFSDLAEFIETETEDKIFHVAGLMYDSEDRQFGQMLDLMPCESITQLTAVCQYCKEDAPFTRHVGPKNSQVEVGAAGKYIAVCRNHRNSN